METPVTNRLFGKWISTYFLSAQASEIFVHHNKAIRGYDPVCFFAEGKAVEGAEEITVEWRGATWYFCSAANRNAFEIAPEKYAPQYGGYCAQGITNKYKAHTEPSTWVIVEGKLYFSYSSKIKSKWEQNRERQIEKADQLWQKVKAIKKIKYTLP
jgi:YHS domain-containing protein